VFALEMKAPEDAPTFPKKTQMVAQGMGEGYDGDVVCELVAHQHFGLDTVIIERVHQSVGS